MHQEKQESQDGRIIMYPDYNIRIFTKKYLWRKICFKITKKEHEY